jgi:hypothetical protein
MIGQKGLADLSTSRYSSLALDPRMTLSDYETILAALNEESKIARLESEAASQNFDDVIRQVPSGLPHPDGVQRIHNASRELSSARERFMASIDRTSKFVVHREVPEDLRERLLDNDAG